MISNILPQKLIAATARPTIDESIRLWRIWWRQISLLLILLAGYYLLEVNGHLKKNVFLDRDIAHINAQFFLATIVAGVLALGYRTLENRRALEKQVQDKEREIRGLKRAALVEFYKSTNDLQHEFKKIRRSLRAASFVDEHGERWIERGDFESLMNRFEDCQLRAESLYREAKARGELFGLEPVRESEGDEDTSLESNSDNPGTVVKINLYKTKKYLRKAVRLYERNFVERRSLSAKELLAIRDGALKEVIDSPRGDTNSKVVPQLFDPMDQVRTNLLKMISDSTPH
jgi:tetratricopeptide (TPR) repeat protein